PQINICDSRVTVLQQQTQRAHELEKNLYDLEHGIWEHFEECARLLQSFDYLNENWQPTFDGIWAANLRVENTLFMAELVRANYFATSDPRELAALVGALAAGDRQIEVEYQEGEESFFLPFKNAVKIARTISKLQDHAGLYFPIILDGDAGRLLWRWADNNIDWEGLFQEVYADDGDVVRLILRTADLLRQLTALYEAFPQLSDTASKAINLIRRPPIDD
ncbi:MAG: Superfamily II RNA helicase, partial [bacterium]